MNRTLVSLSLNGIKQQYMTSSLASSPQFFNFINMKLSNSFSTFFSSRFSLGGMKVSGSTFSNFLSPVLALASDFDIIGVQETKHQNVMGHMMDVLIIDSSFSHCTNTLGHGGAIIFDRKTLSARFDRVWFVQCSAKRSGGAFYSVLDNITVTRSCFEECTAQESGHSFFINLHSKESTANISEVTILRSGSQTLSNGKCTGLFMLGEYRTQLVNASNNNALAFSAIFGCILSTNFTSSFCEFSNSSSYHILKFLEVNISVFIAFCNFLDNKAQSSLISTSSGNNIINSVFIRNDVSSLITGNVKYLQMADCVMDQEYDFSELSYYRTPNLEIKSEPLPLQLQFAFVGAGRILGPKEGLGGSDVIQGMLNNLVQSSTRFIELFKDRLIFSPVLPTPRDGIYTEPPEEVATHSYSIPARPSRKRPIPDPQSKSISPKIGQPHSVEYEDPDSHSPTRKRSQHPSRPGKKTPIRRVITPSNSFSPSETFFKSRTFLPSLQFTASVSPAQSLVPYVLYSAAGFVVFAVLISFLFLKSSDAGYNLMTPSGSADSRLSDYISSTSTTVTITGTGDSSSIAP